MSIVKGEEGLDLKILEAYFRTTKKTIQEYVREIERYCRFKSVYGATVVDGTVLDDRSKLIDLYEACVQQDAHLAGVLETLKSQIKGERYGLYRCNEKGKYVRDIKQSKIIQGTQFGKIIDGIVEAKLYGYTGIEIMPYTDPLTGRLKEVNLIERRNILPEQKRIVRRSGIYYPGWSFEDKIYQGNYVLINNGDLGLFSATTPLILAKKFTFANYVNFSHTYGQPIIHGKTESENQQDRKKLANDIASAAQNKVIVTGLSDEVDIKTFTMSNSEKVFTGLTDGVDRDVSNLLLGSESMAGATQSYVGATKAHEDIFRDRVKAYRDYIENVMNEEIIPRLIEMGVIESGLEFKYAKNLEMSDEDRIKLYDLLTDKYEVSPDEIEKTFGVVVGEQFNVTQGFAGGTGGVGGDWGNEDGRTGPRRMSDEEYYKRYGHTRNSMVNFLKGKRN